MPNMEDEDDSIQHRHPESKNFPVEGMEAVVATVSGYHGTERFNLIKLIARAGASYVGSMNQCTTHLVCWKFEGRKYELAKKLKILIVNHRWIEECVKNERRVSEEPYSFQSGEEIGPLSLDILPGTKAQSHVLKKKKGHVIDIDCDDTEDDAWTDPTLSDEDLFSQPMEKKSIRKRSSNNCPSSSKYCDETLSRTTVLELGEASTSLPICSSRRRRGKSTSLERISKGRRLVKKHACGDALSLEDCEEVRVSPRRKSSVLSDSAVVERHQRLSSRNKSSISCFFSGQDKNDAHHDVEEIDNVNNTDARHDVEEIENMNCEHQNASVGAISSLPPIPGDARKPAHDDFADINPVDGLAASGELSCVICWTDFSSTRGVLPCGHRFCFSCIQSWADHMAAIKKPSTCPLCKAYFICITKVEDALSSDQKIYSQSIPPLRSNMDLYILPDETHAPPSNQSESVCCRCFSREPEDLLIWCHFCQVRCVHSYCLDPMLLPWTCTHCKDLQMLYHHSR